MKKTLKRRWKEGRKEKDMEVKSLEEETEAKGKKEITYGIFRSGL